MRRVNTSVSIKSEVNRAVPEFATVSSKRGAKEELDQGSSKRRKTVPEEGIHIEALQTKYPIIDWEIYTKESRMYWKIIRVDNHTKGRKIDEIDQNFDISLIQHDAEIQGRYDQYIEFNLDFDADKEVYTAAKEVSTAEIVSTAAQYFTEEEWENIRARVEADEELTQRLQAKERNKYSKVDQAKMLVDLINQRKRYFTTQKAKAKRNKPMTQAQ
nr:hypothetical protein [Tanacetum cinerariifolium]